MNATDCFGISSDIGISYLAPEMSKFKELQHNATTKTIAIAEAKIVMSPDVYVDR